MIGGVTDAMSATGSGRASCAWTCRAHLPEQVAGRYRSPIDGCRRAAARDRHPAASGSPNPGSPCTKRAASPWRRWRSWRLGCRRRDPPNARGDAPPSQAWAVFDHPWRAPVGIAPYTRASRSRRGARRSRSVVAARRSRKRPAGRSRRPRRAKCAARYLPVATATGSRSQSPGRRRRFLRVRQGGRCRRKDGVSLHPSRRSGARSRAPGIMVSGSRPRSTLTAGFRSSSATEAAAPRPSGRREPRLQAWHARRAGQTPDERRPARGIDSADGRRA